MSIFGAYIYYFEIYKEDQKTEATFQSSLVVKLPMLEIDKIHFVNSYDQFDLVKKNGEWYLESPVKDFADKFIINKLLDFFSKQKVLQDFTKDVTDESKFGFNKKNNWIQVSAKNGPSIKIYISETVGIQGNTYLKVIEGKTNYYYLASPEWRGEFDRTVLYYRDKFIFHEDMNLLTKIQKWTKGKLIYEVEDKGKEKDQETWYWQDTRLILIDKEMIYNIIDELVQASASDFLDYNDLDKKSLKQFGLIEPLPSFKLFLSSGKVLEFKYSIPNKQKTYLIYNDRVYELFNNALSFFDWQLDDYKNRGKPFALDMDSLTGIAYSKAKDSKHFEKKDKVWTSNFPGNRFTRILTEMRAKEFLPNTLPPVFDSSLTFSSDEGELLRLSWSREGMSGSEILMTSSKINETFLVEAKEWVALMKILEGDTAWDSKDVKSK